MVGAVGEVANMKRHKLWKTGEDGRSRCSSAIQTWLGPSSLLEEQSGTLFCCFLCVVSYPPPPKKKMWGNGQGIWIDRLRPSVFTLCSLTWSVQFVLQ